MVSQRYQDNIVLLLQKIQEAEAIVVGAAAGMYEAAGYNWYRTDETFLKHFGKFAEKYRLVSIFNGYYYRFPTREERWAFIATLSKFVYDAKVGQPYLDLFQLIQDKDYYIVTTNQDTQFSKVFPEEKVSAIQGDLRYFQCSCRCHDQIYLNQEEIEEIYANIEGTRIPTELIPRCSICGQDMEPWVRSCVFLEGSSYKRKLSKYEEYLRKNKTKKVLFLELGVGNITPMLIKEPFWRMTNSWPNAYNISINPQDVIVLPELREKGFVINEDIARVLQDALNEKAKRGQ